MPTILSLGAVIDDIDSALVLAGIRFEREKNTMPGENQDCYFYGSNLDGIFRFGSVARNKDGHIMFFVEDTSKSKYLFQEGFFETEELAVSWKLLAGKSDFIKWMTSLNFDSQS